MAKTTSIKEIKSWGEKKRLQDEVSDKAFEKALSEIADEAIRRELRKLYEKLKDKIKEKAKKEAERIAKKLLKRLLESLGAGAGRFAGPMWWIWEQAGILGDAVGNWAADTVDKARNDTAIGWFKNLSLKQLQPLSPGTFTHVISVETVIVDKKGKPVSADYKINFKQSLGTDLQLKGTTGSAGYGHSVKHEESRDWPFAIKSVEIDVAHINKLEYILEKKIKGSICTPGSMIVFRVVIKAVVAKEEKEGGCDFFLPGETSEPINWGQPLNIKFTNIAESSRFILHPPGALDEYVQLAVSGDSGYTLQFEELNDHNVALITLSKFNLIFKPFEVGNLEFLECSIVLKDSYANSGTVNKSTGEFFLNFAGTMRHERLNADESIVVKGSLDGIITNDGLVLLDGVANQIYPMRMVELIA